MCCDLSDEGGKMKQFKFFQKICAGLLIISISCSTTSLETFAETTYQEPEHTEEATSVPEAIASETETAEISLTETTEALGEIPSDYAETEESESASITETESATEEHSEINGADDVIHESENET